MAKSKTALRSAEADDRIRKSFPSSAASEPDVARRAYELYVDRGREDGHDVDDWLQAERELGRRSSATDK